MNDDEESEKEILDRVLGINPEKIEEFIRTASGPDNVAEAIVNETTALAILANQIEGLLIGLTYQMEGEKDVAQRITLMRAAQLLQYDKSELIFVVNVAIQMLAKTVVAINHGNIVQTIETMNEPDGLRDLFSPSRKTEGK